MFNAFALLPDINNHEFRSLQGWQQNVGCDETFIAKTPQPFDSGWTWLFFSVRACFEF